MKEIEVLREMVGKKRSSTAQSENNESPMKKQKVLLPQYQEEKNPSQKDKLEMILENK